MRDAGCLLCGEKDTRCSQYGVVVYPLASVFVPPLLRQFVAYMRDRYRGGKGVLIDLYRHLYSKSIAG